VRSRNAWLRAECEFWRKHLPEGRESVCWEKVLRLLVVNRLLEPGSEFRVHRHWFVESAVDALLEENFAVADASIRAITAVDSTCGISKCRPIAANQRR